MLERLGMIVSEVGEGLLRWRDQAIQGEWHGTQLKTAADRDAHQSLSRALRSLSNLPVISEEDEASHRIDRPDRYWLIDPIDGTASLAGGFPGFVTQAALMERDVPILSAIRASALDLLYLAERGAGAVCNGSRLSVHKSRDTTTLVDNYPEPRGAAAKLMQYIPCSGYLESGSISLKICRIADGTADIFFKDVTVRDWDIASPHLVLTEAGGTIIGSNGKPYVFTGALEKPGIIAARTSKLASHVARFMRHQSGIRND